MKVNSTEFRKNMFQLVERALHGELVEILYKGRVIRLVPEEKATKLSRLIAHDSINGTLDDLEQGQRELDDEMRTSWEAKWANKL